MLELRGVSAGYGRIPVLFGIDFTVSEGEMVGVIGANGAGKSTLLKTILGLVPTRSGEIVFRGQRVTHEPAHARVAAGISLVPEGRRTFKHLSVRENLLAGSYGVSSRALEEELRRCHEIFPILEERRNQQAGSLSGGEQQMLAIARALMAQPRLLLVDELSMGLAPLVITELMQTLGELCKEGLQVVVVDQFASGLEGLADRAVVIEKGSIIFEGSVEAADICLSRHYLDDDSLVSTAE